MTSLRDRLQTERFVVGDPEIASQYRDGVLSRPMTHEQRRQLIETPIVITVHGHSYRTCGVNLEWNKLRATDVTPDTDCYYGSE